MMSKNVMLALALGAAFLGPFAARADAACLPQGPVEAAAPTQESTEPAPAAPPALSELIAVVDVERVLQGYPKARELRQAQELREEEVNAELSQGRDELQKLKLEADGWDPGTPEWMAAQIKLAAKETELLKKKEFEERAFLIESYKNRDLLYRDIDRAIQELADKRGLLLVVQKIAPREDDMLDARVAKLAQRPVLYYRTSLDLTEDVINFLKSEEFVGNSASRAPK